MIIIYAEIYLTNVKSLQKHPVFVISQSLLVYDWRNSDTIKQQVKTQEKKSVCSSPVPLLRLLSHNPKEIETHK